MKVIRIILTGIAFISLVSCNSGQEKFDWLLGDWQRSNEEAGVETFESWEKLSSFEYQGIGFTMQDGDTLWQEDIKLIHGEDGWELRVKTPGEADYTCFLMAEHKPKEFTCVNEEHDFPTEIKYWREGDLLRALVSGTDMEIAFDFEPLLQ